MPVTYTPCQKPIHAQLAAVVKAHHPDLTEAEVTFLLLFAHAPRGETGEVMSTAIKHHGYPALALVSVVNLKDRVAGLPDARIIIDGDRWKELSEAEQDALLDHECQHVEVKRDDEGVIVADDVGRPKLSLRPHDVEIGVFHSVVKRHGYNAAEAKAFAQLHQKWTQESFQWG